MIDPIAPRFTALPSISQEVEANRIFWKDTALSILSLSIVSALGVGITACVITIPTIPLCVTIGVIALSVISSLVLYSQNETDENTDNPSFPPHPQATSISHARSGGGFFSSFLPSKNITIIGIAATDDQLKAASFKLPNPGSNCFMHATLQLIFQDKAVSDYFMQALEGISKNDTFKDLNPALACDTIEVEKQTPEGVKKQTLYKGDAAFKTLNDLEAALVQLKNDQTAIEKLNGFSTYFENKQQIASLEEEKKDLLKACSTTKEIEPLKTRIEAIDARIKTIMALEQPLAAGAASSSKDCKQQDFSKKYAEYLALRKQIQALEKKHSEWKQYTALKALHQKDIDAKIARYKAVDKEALYEKANLEDQDLENLYYALSIQEAAKKAHAILTLWRTDKEISANASKLLRVCLTKLLSEETIISIPDADACKKPTPPSLDELIKETHKGTSTLKYAIDRTCPTRLLIKEYDEKGMLEEAWVFKQDHKNPDVFRSKAGVIFSTKAKALQAIAEEESRKPKFFLRNNCHKKQGTEETSIAFSCLVQDDAPKLLDELAHNLLKLHPTLPCPFQVRTCKQTKRCTYEEDTLPVETALEPLEDHESSLILRPGSEDFSIDLEQDLRTSFKKYVTKPAIPYTNTGTDKITGIKEGRNYYTERFTWMELPTKLIIAPTFARNNQDPRLVKKALKFTDNEHLIIDLTGLGEKPDGSKLEDVKYILNGFTLKSGSQTGGHYVYYARHYEKEGDVTTSYWIRTSDACVERASCEEVARLLLTCQCDRLHPNTLIFDRLKEALPKE